MQQKTKNVLLTLGLAAVVLIGIGWQKTGIALLAVTALLTLLMLKVAPVPKRVRAQDIVSSGGKYVKLPDGRLLEFFEVGDSTGYPVLYMHGGAMDGRSLLALPGVGQFAKQNKIRFLSISAPAQGLSDFKANWRLIDFPADVAVLLNECKVDKFAATGWSFGANLALTMARSPELSARCEHVLALAPARGSDYKDPGVPSRFRPFFVGLPVVSELMFYGMTRQTNPAAFREGMCSQNNDHAELDDPANKDAVDALFADIVRAIHWSKAHSMLTLNVLDEPFGFDTIEIRQAQSGKGRVIIASGLNDEYVPPFHQKSLAKRIPGAKLVEFPKNGHYGWLVHYKSLVLQMLGRSN